MILIAWVNLCNKVQNQRIQSNCQIIQAKTLINAPEHFYAPLHRPVNFMNKAAVVVNVIEFITSSKFTVTINH